MTHKYFEVVPLTSTSGVLYTYFFRANDMFDPNQTGTGHQPMYFDQMSALYDHFTVIGSKITLKICNTSTGNTAAIVGVMLNDDGTPTGTITAMVEHSKSKYRLIPAGSNETIVFTMGFSTGKTFGRTGMLQNDNLQGNATTSPSEQSSYMLFYQPTDNTSSQSVQVEVQIEYIAVWTEIKDIGSS